MLYAYLWYVAYERFQSRHFGFHSGVQELVYLGRYNNRGLKTKWRAHFKVYGIVLQPTVALTTNASLQKVPQRTRTTLEDR